MSPNIPASIKARLLNGARSRNQEFQLTLVRFAIERLLYRLGASSVRDRFILKGAGLLGVWLDDPHRSTRDVDVLAFGANDESSVRALIAEACAVPCPEDGLSFDSASAVVEDIRSAEEYVGKRVRLVARLGKARAHLQVDIGFGDALALPADEIVYPTILDDLPAPRLRGYPREASIAEKFHAMVSLDVQNSRMKDFHDIWALAGAFAYEGTRLLLMIAACFERRKTAWAAETPRALTPGFYQIPDIADRWRRYLQTGTILVRPPAQFELVGERIIRFLGPVRDSLAGQEAFSKGWSPGGPWR